MILNLGIPKSEYPDLEGTESGTLVICGGAKCVWDDVFACSRLMPSKMVRELIDCDIMTVSDITMHFHGKVKHAYSNDHEQILRHCHNRRDTLVHEYGKPEHVHSRLIWPWPGQGSSGLGAVYTGLGLGYDSITLCGIPLDGSPHYFDPPWATSNVGKEDIKHWEKARDNVFDGKVKSMSGRTCELLGSP